MPVPHRRLRRAFIPVGALIAGALALTGCAPSTPPAKAEVVRVPADEPTIGAAVDAVAEGGLILVSPGRYAEQVLVDTADVTIRGLDRDDTVIDAEGTRPYGIVAIADGVTVENLSVTGATFYGVLVTGLHDDDGPSAHGVDGYDRLDPDEFPPIQRFAIDSVTAYNNGLYGLYAFNAQHGVIRDSYASGSADSGIYVGQCEECDILVQGNVAENNAVGFENANASDSVVVVGNRFSGNRIGMTILSNYQEAFSPQRDNAIVGNLVAFNAAADSPAHADGGFGIGIGVGAGTRNTFERNAVLDNPRAGVLLSSTEDLAATGNTFVGNGFGGNGVDVANTSGSRAPARANCGFDGAATFLPADLLSPCPSEAEQPAAEASEIGGPPAPPGVSFLRIAPPPSQPDLSDLEGGPRRLPDAVVMPDLTGITLPTPEFLADRARG